MQHPISKRLLTDEQDVARRLLKVYEIFGMFDTKRQPVQEVNYKVIVIDKKEATR